MPHLIKRTIPLLLCAALLIGCLTGCGSEKTPEEDATPTDVTAGKSSTDSGDRKFTLNCDRNYAFNPLTTPNGANQLVAELMYDTIYDTDTEFLAQPKLVTSASTEDGVHWLFKVDTTVTFWDGTALSAYDLGYSIRQAMASATYRPRLSCIAGVSSMDVETLAITLSYPDMLLPSLLNIPVIRDSQGDLSVPQGTGPYQPDEGMTELTAYEGHRDYAKLPIKTVYLEEYSGTEGIITAFDNGDIDLVMNDPNSAASLGFGSSNESRYYNTTNLNFIGFNCKRQFFSFPACRRAMTYIVDREKIVSESMKGAGVAATLPVNPSASIYNNSYSDLISYSQKKSEAALNEANVQDYDEDGFREIMITGIPCEINLDFVVCSDSSNKVAAARTVAENLKALDIKVTLRELGWDEYKYAVVNGECDMYYGEVKLTGDFNIRQLIASGGTLNYGGYTDAAMEQYVSDYLAAADDTRQNAADLMFKYCTDSAPFIPVCFEKKQVVTHKGVVSGLKPTQYNIFHDLGSWKISFD